MQLNGADTCWCWVSGAEGVTWEAVVVGKRDNKPSSWSVRGQKRNTDTHGASGKYRQGINFSADKA